MKKKIIYLTGFMASGKSTYGRILANVLGWKFYDLDKLIEKREGKEIVDIFKEYGEQYFRELETKVLKEISDSENIVVALGGGTIVNDDNLTICKDSGVTIYLKCSVNTIFHRIRRKTTRPLFRDLIMQGKNKEIKEKITSMLAEREKYYKKADLIINTDKRSLGKTIDYINHRLNKYI